MGSKMHNWVKPVAANDDMRHCLLVSYHLFTSQIVQAGGFQLYFFINKPAAGFIDLRRLPPVFFADAGIF
jgi:hypothetical protein